MLYLHEPRRRWSKIGETHVQVVHCFMLPEMSEVCSLVVLVSFSNIPTYLCEIVLRMSAAYLRYSLTPFRNPYGRLKAGAALVRAYNLNPRHSY